jgi:hypothetical protein
MRIRPHSIPGQDPSTVALRTVTTEPGRTALGISVDAGAAQRGPLRRDRGPAHVLREGRRITDPAELRADLPPAVEGPCSHLATWRAAYPGRDPLAVVGCGNLAMNSGVLLRAGGVETGIPGPWGLALTVDPDGRGRADPDRDPPPGGFSLTGPALVLEGHPAPLRPETYADPRHLLRFPYVMLDSGERLDFGQDQILGDHELYRRAASGDPVVLRLTVPPAGPGRTPRDRLAERVRPDALRAALATKGYRETSRAEGPGTFRLGENELEIAFLPGLYPHHVLALDSRGRVHSLLITGLSNRTGVVAQELAEDLAAAGFSHALLVDNGGDVGLYLPREARFAIRPAEADRSLHWPLTACLIYHDSARGP